MSTSPGQSSPTPKSHIGGLSEADARKRFPGDGNVRVARWRLDHLDRAMTDQDQRGFIKVVHRSDGEVLSAQIVAARAGEIVHELSLAIDRRIKLGELASSIHVYPTYAIEVQQLAAELQLESLSASRAVKLARRLTSLRRS